MEIGNKIIKLRRKDKVYEAVSPIERSSLKLGGVWALFGQRKKGSKYDCLNVGKSKDIGREILYDLSCLSYIEGPKDDGYPYINWFGEEFGFNTKVGQTQESLYPFIRKNYENLVFVLAYERNNKDTDKTLRAKECEIAKAYHALFWRNGNAYRKPPAIIKNSSKTKGPFNTLREIKQSFQQTNVLKK